MRVMRADWWSSPITCPLELLPHDEASMILLFGRMRYLLAQLLPRPSRARAHVALLILVAMPGARTADAQTPTTVRVATFNIEDVRTSDLRDPTHPRVRRIAETIQRLRPTIILINEIAYDMPGAPGAEPDAEPGQNARRLVEHFLATPQAPGLEPLNYHVFMAPSNTGMPSGFDLNNDGVVVTRFPPLPRAPPDGSPPRQTDAGRAYANDCWGFGTFPGQYAMALLVDPRVSILRDRVRTFRLLPWRYMPGSLMPPVAGESPAPAPNPGAPTNAWFSPEEADLFRLSSKSHWDVPVRLPNGAVVHLLCSHPTPPAFEGEELRNSRRNHDEIRFWADYIEGAGYIVDDRHRRGPLPPDAHFVILGDLNADPAEGTRVGNPIRDLLLASRRVHPDRAPSSEIAIPGLDPTDTARWGKRVDHVLPSADLEPIRAGVWRHVPDTHAPETRVPDGEDDARSFPSDHFPVWMEIRVPPPTGTHDEPADATEEPGG